MELDLTWNLRTYLVVFSKCVWETDCYENISREMKLRYEKRTKWKWWNVLCGEVSLYYFVDVRNITAKVDT